MRPLAFPRYATFLAVAPVAIHIEPLLVGLSELARPLVEQYLVSIRVVAARLRFRHSPRFGYIVVPTACFTTSREASRYEQRSYRQQQRLHAHMVHAQSIAPPRFP